MSDADSLATDEGSPQPMNDQSAASSEQTVLLVEDVVAVREGLKALLSKRYQVSVAESAEQALAMLANGLQARVVICDYHLPGMTGIECLGRVKREWPNIVNIMLTGVAELDVAVRSLHEGSIFRFLTKPCAYEQLCEALDEAFALSSTELTRQLEARELQFSRESLLRFNENLEERVLNQMESLRRLHAFAVELNKATTLHQIARLSVEALHGTLSGRGVHVQIWDRDRVDIEESLGPEMSAVMHREVLGSQDGPVGEIVVDRYDPLGKALADVDADFLVSIASSTAVAVRNEFRRMERDQAQYATIVALARLSEQRDNETGKHLERVSLYCELIAESLRAEGLFSGVIDDVFVEDLSRSAPLHDIGKVGIPDSILMKPGKLTPSEWEVMKTHAEIGAQTLESVIREGLSQGFLEMGREIAWSHHEKWDGSGYPRGLRGDEIPLSARILALADVYDALTTVRPYKAAWTHDESIAYISDHAGTQFDPVLARIFVEREKAADEIRTRLADTLSDTECNARDRLARSA